ncbi:ankyrin repeat-containing protein, partial [Tanacetum coccineum]
GIRKLDASMKAMKEGSDEKFKELKKLILGTSTHVDHVLQTTKGAGTNQAGDRFAYYEFKHRMRKLKTPVSEGEDEYGWIYRVERRLLIRFQQSQEGNLYEQFLAITQEESARAYAALFEKLACQLVGIPESVMEATFIKGLKPVLRAPVRVMNPEGLNNAMELAVSIEDNQLYEGVMQSKGVVAVVRQTTSKGDNFQRMTESEIQDRKAKGLCFRCEEKYTPGHRCASRTLQVEPDLNFKSWDRGSKID